MTLLSTTFQLDLNNILCPLFGVIVRSTEYGVRVRVYMYVCGVVIINKLPITPQPSTFVRSLSQGDEVERLTDTLRAAKKALCTRPIQVFCAGRRYQVILRRPGRRPMEKGQNGRRNHKRETANFQEFFFFRIVLSCPVTGTAKPMTGEKSLPCFSYRTPLRADTDRLLQAVAVSCQMGHSVLAGHPRAYVNYYTRGAL